MKRYLFSFALALWATALSAQAHWPFDYHQFKYEMTVYFELLSNGKPLTTPNNYEVAAFVGDECRGIATFETQTSSTGTELSYGFLKVYSDVTSGETITFKCYKKATGKESDIEGASLPFVSSTAVGYPTEPMPLDIGDFALMRGDVNDDGEIDIADAVCIVNHIVGTPNATFLEDAADVNNDKAINIADALHIVDLVVGKTAAWAPRRDESRSEPE